MTAGFIASFAMGIVLGLMGGGGSILTVPILVYLFKTPPLTATGYSLFVVGITALIGALMYFKKGEIDLKSGVALAIPSTIGVSLSRIVILPNIPETIWKINGFTFTKDFLIMFLFSILMIVASFSMIKKKSEEKPLSAKSSGQILSIALQGLALGLIAGFVGAGGGFLIIPALVFLIRLPMKKAVGTSLMVITFQSLIGFSAEVINGSQVEWRFLITVAVCAVFGIISGSIIAEKINEQTLKKAFGIFVLAMGTMILIEQVRNLT